MSVARRNGCTLGGSSRVQRLRKCSDNRESPSLNSEWLVGTACWLSKRFLKLLNEKQTLASMSLVSIVGLACRTQKTFEISRICGSRVSCLWIEQSSSR